MGEEQIHVPRQEGRTAIVTGTGGLGFQAALALARAGADVFLAGRDRGKGEQAVPEITAQAPAARVQFEALDLANLASVAAFASAMRTLSTRAEMASRKSDQRLAVRVTEGELSWEL